MSSTHLVEFGVREASLCAMAHRSERTRTFYTLIRSIICKAASRSVVVQMKGKQLRANQHLDKGIKTERETKSKEAKRKHEGNAETRDRDSPIIGRTPRGSVRAHHLLRTIQDVNKQVGAILGYEEKRKKNIGSFNDQFAKTRVDNEVKAFAAKRHTKRRSVVEQETGVDVTGKSRGMLRLTKILAVHLQSLEAELVARNVAVQPGQNATAIKGILKRHLLAKDPVEITKDNYFKPMSSELIALL
jgi:hypothetical protein